MKLQTVIVYSLFLIVMCYCGTLVARTQYANLSNKGRVQTKYPNHIVIVMFFFFAILTGLRYDVGTDYLIYLDSYLTGGNTRFELLFSFIETHFSRWGIHPTIFFGLLALMQVSFFFSAFKDERYLFPFLVFFLFTNGLFGSWVNTIRQDIAICIWLFGSRYIFENKIYKYLLFCALAYGFHRSSVLFVFLYPLFRNGKDILKNIPLQLIIYLFAFILSQFIMDYIMRLDGIMERFSSLLTLGDSSKDFYSTYSVEGSIDQIKEAGNTVVQTGVAVIFKFLCYGLIILYSKKLKSFYNSKSFNTYYFFYFIALIAKVIMPNGAFNLMRPFQFTMPFLTIMMAFFVYYLIHNRNIANEKMDKALGYGIIIAFIGILFFSILTSSSSGYKLYFQM
ncbi:MAG: EpsG family protein [Bacteroidales bacterium]|nr:EpsG family protein [Bacteroidales bacterium]